MELFIVSPNIRNENNSNAGFNAKKVNIIKFFEYSLINAKKIKILINVNKKKKLEKKYFIGMCKYLFEAIIIVPNKPLLTRPSE